MITTIRRAAQDAGRSALHLLMGCMLVAGLATGASAQERTAISGTTVSLTPLKGFAPSAKFAGLEHAEAKASVLVVEMPPEAHAQLSTLFGNADTAKANFAKQNIVIDEAEDIETAGGKGRILTGQQNVAGTTFDKWIVLLKGAKTVMITVQAPEDSDLDGDDVVTMLKSVSLGAEPTLDQKLAALPFRVRASEPFRVVDTFGGLGVLMTSGPLNVDPKGSQPMLIVSYQTGGQVAAGQLAAVGEKLLQTTRGFEKAEITKRDTVAFAGSKDGAMLSGTITEGSARKRFAQYMGLGADGRFVRMIVSADEATYPSLESAIKAIADSIAFAK
ncbi:hypothetical protein ASE66_15420 [Bosea sp. Root483D1]|uniref:hypothetical protein n=1 Tax=Bosea sp. Root483D1 TaxID=1736544 RepID=UPI00070E44AA|nr:hypothetical protein [Bosea sp. Root483D1]KRE14731.1 hypothetical protein ASE66_15420 [Bosea sp. Root483D1]